MWKCTDCGALTEDRIKVCSNCGAYFEASMRLEPGKSLEPDRRVDPNETAVAWKQPEGAGTQPTMGYSSTEATVHICRIMLVLGKLLAVIVGLTTLFQVVGLASSLEFPAVAILLALGMGVLMALLAWAVPSFLGHIGLTLVDVKSRLDARPQETPGS